MVFPFRRTAISRSRAAVAGAKLVHGPLSIDLAAHRAWSGANELVLTALEFKLLHTFFQRAGRVQTREQLLSDVWGITSEVESRTVDTHVKRLREKLGEARELIETVRGVGYRMKAKEAR